MKRPPVRVTDHSFTSRGVIRPGLPIVCWADGTVCVPATAYLFHSGETRRVSDGTLLREAYSIREWLAFLDKRRENWDRPSDVLLGAWYDEQVAQLPDSTSARGRAEVNVSRVFRFYLDLPKALPFEEDGRRRAILVRPPGASGPAPALTAKTLSYRGVDRVVWSGIQGFQPAPASPHTSSADEVSKILEELRNKRGLVDAEGRRVWPLSSRFIAQCDRNWLLGRCKAEGGLRDMEVAQLSVDSLEHALRAEGVLSKASTGLDGISEDPGAQDALLDGLDRLQLDGKRDHLFVTVVGKGRKPRLARFPIDLVREVLQLAVWSGRRNVISRWRKRDAGYEPPGNIFLSLKTGLGLRPGSIGDVMATAYGDAKVAGSGHRLRAHYCTMAAARIWMQSCSMAGGVYTPEAQREALDLLADELGHSRVSTTTKNYLNMALSQQFLMQGSARYALLQAVMHSVLRSDRPLSEDHVRHLAKAFNALAALSEGANPNDAVKIVAPGQG